MNRVVTYVSWLKIAKKKIKTTLKISIGTPPEKTKTQKKKGKYNITKVPKTVWGTTQQAEICDPPNFKADLVAVAIEIS